MKWCKKFIKDESGAAQLIELSLWVPLTLFIIFFLIFVGLYILQQMTVASYAQKIALLAAREVSSPGYYTLLSPERYETAAAEADFNVFESDDGSYKITVSNKANEAEVRAYRYWGKPLRSKECQFYGDILTELVKKNSILNAGNVTANITCENNILSQTIHVSVEQKMMNIGLLEILGVESPTVKATASASVNDVDEIIRNTDFACDAIDALATHFNIPLDDVKSKVKGVLEDFGLL